MIGEVLGGNDRLDAGQCLGFRRVDRADARMGMRRADALTVERAGGREIRTIHRAPRHLRHPVRTDRPSPNPLEPRRRNIVHRTLHSSGRSVMHYRRATRQQMQDRRRKTMAGEVRRIVTGHDATGKAVVKTDERLQAVSRLGRPHIAGCEIWSTDKMAVDNSEEADPAQRAGFVKRYNYVGTGQGTVIRITEFAPGAPKFLHRTETVDYAPLLPGPGDPALHTGKILHMKPGDIVVQRGTMHAWVNNSTAPPVFAFTLIDAAPAKAGGQELRTHFPAP